MLSSRMDYRDGAAILTMLMLLVPAARAAAPPTLPPRAVCVARGRVWAPRLVTDQDLLLLTSAPLAGGPVTVVDCYEIALSCPPKCHIAYGALWAGLAFDHAATSDLYKDRLWRSELSGLVRGKLLPSPGERPVTLSLDIPFDSERLRFAYDDIVSSLKLFSALEREYHSDYLPTGMGEARQFVLTDFDRELDNPPAWSFTVWTYRARWDKAGQFWAPQRGWDWKKVERVEVAFREPFRVLSRGEDYYFLTSGGSLYRSPPPARRGMMRQVLLVHDGTRRRITATVEDGDSGRAFLFVGPDKAGGRPAFFELASTVKLQHYAPADLPAAEGDEPLRSDLRLARLLAARRLIEGKPPMEDAPKRP